jgi:hypothetical protein
MDCAGFYATWVPRSHTKAGDIQHILWTVDDAPNTETKAWDNLRDQSVGNCKYTMVFDGKSERGGNFSETPEQRT